MNKRYVVLGADGFIGRNLVIELAKNQQYEIIAMDIYPDLLDNNNHQFLDYDNVEIVAANCYDKEVLRNTINSGDYIFHLASRTNPANTDNNPYLDLEQNVIPTLHLLEICLKKKISKFIFPSSGGTVYGNQNIDHLGENIIPQPVSPYGIGKLSIEHYLRYYHEKFGMKYIAYRISNPYGPGQRIRGNQGVIPIFIYKIINKLNLDIYGDGTMVRDYLYIDDLVSMIAGSFEKDTMFAEYNLGSGIGVSINEIVSYIEKHSQLKAHIKYVTALPTYVKRNVLDISRFTREFNIKPLVGLDEGIRRTYEYVCSKN